MTSNAVPDDSHRSLEIPVEELMRRVRPLPSYESSVIADLTEEEEDAFLVAIGA